MSGFNLGNIAAGATLLGGVMSVMGGLQTGDAQKKAAYYNAARDEQGAALVLDAGEQNAQLIKLQGDRQQAQGMANMAAAGVDISSGSPIMADAQAAKYVAQDMSRVRYQAALQAWQMRSEAQIERFTGKQMQRSSWWGAAGTLLQTGAQTAYVSQLTNSVNQPYVLPEVK